MSFVLIDYFYNKKNSFCNDKYFLWFSVDYYLCITLKNNLNKMTIKYVEIIIAITINSVRNVQI